MMGWEGPAGPVGRIVQQQTEACLRVYAQDPSRIEEDAAIEVAYSEGGYQRKQLFELLQNSADALRGAPGRAEVLLDSHRLYVANEGRPFSIEGVSTLLASHLSRKGEADIGQYGLGFKSVLAVSDSPAVYSRTGSFQFDRSWAAARITEAGLTSAKYPVLRLARPVVPCVAARSDQILAGLMEWASTVVVVPLKRGHALLQEDLKDFPGQFVLFSPQVRSLQLRDLDANVVRSASVERVGELLRLSGESGSVDWVVQIRAHKLSRDARKDAGELVKRASVEVSWAAPIGRPAGVGSFWAYFPTNIQTTLSGIVNAPWKLSADRLSMLEGDYNRELLTEVVPQLVTDALARLFVPEKPGVHLDVLPARGREARSRADDLINKPVFEAVSQRACLPDVAGRLQVPSGMRVVPKEVRSEWLEGWVPKVREHWVHPACVETQERRLKTERLVLGDVLQSGEAGSALHTSVATWLESMVAPSDAPACAAAIHLAARISREDPTQRAEIRKARIILLEDGTLAAPVPGKLFVRSSADARGHDFIHDGLTREPGVSENLLALGIEVLNPAGELRALLQAAPEKAAWREVWDKTQEVEVETAWQIFQDEVPHPLVEHVHARVRSGKWVPIRSLFLPGGVLPNGGNSDVEYALDADYHAPHMELLHRCGAVSGPVIEKRPDEPWLANWKTQQALAYRDRNKNPRPAFELVRVAGSDVPWPLEPLPDLSMEAKVRVSEAVMAFGGRRGWSVFHKTNSQYPNIRLINPAIERMQRFGALRTTIGPYPTRLCLHPNSELPDSFPKAQISDEWAQAFGLGLDCDNWSDEDWEHFLRQSESQRSGSCADVYAIAAWWGRDRPAQVVALVPEGRYRTVAADEVAVTTEDDVAKALVAARIPVLRVSTDEYAEKLIDFWKMPDGADQLKEEVVPQFDAEPVLLIDRFPPLRLYDEIEGLDDLQLQTCRSIDVLMSTPKGQESRPVQQMRQGDALLVRAGSDEQILGRVAQLLHASINVRNVMDDMKQVAASELIQKIRGTSDLADKLALMVGVEALRTRIPRTALADIESQEGALDPHAVAELAMAVHGYPILADMREELEGAGLEPPRTWAGGREARRFVEGLGFPAEYAGFAGGSLAATVEVEGRIDLPPLHDYQARVVERVRGLLVHGADPKRGIITLPTGAGKTRVAVEAVVGLVVDKALEGPVVWITESEELCEQAVQAWAYVWRAIGVGALVVSRLWSSNGASEAPAGTFQVVVATIDKLLNAKNDQGYAWLAEPGLIIIDEAHTSITQSYTAALKWLGGEKVTTRMTTPLLGLTATAFRGHNQEETERLVKRYNSTKLDEGVFGDEDPYAYLQRTGILANVHQLELTGMNITLDAESEAHLKQFGVLLRRIEQDVGQNRHRNQTILESVLGQPEDWPILLFASSVEHARAMAAELTYYGVEARPIDGKTSTALRRKYVEQFRAGEIRVLTNYNVLTQGFDAPRVRAVYVTRPTFSPNLYQQMIGRGLRGPLNGGSDEVLIVNVADNLSQYGQQLAFHHFDYLWSSDNDK